MEKEIRQTIDDHTEDDPFNVVTKSSVKLKKTSRGISWEIKVVSGEENLIDGLMIKAIKVHKKMEVEFKNG